MEMTLIRHPRLGVRWRSGAEGPRHDPYHYEEYTITAPNKKLVIHLGLAEWMELNGEAIDVRNHREIESVTAEIVGFTLAQIHRIHGKAKSICPKGGRHEVFYWDGYPGEHFASCTKCEKVVDSAFDRSAIE